MTSVIVKELPKSGDLETFNLYIKDAPVFYACVHEVKQKFNSTDKEFSVTVFIDDETKDKLEDDILVNKTFSKVGVTKTTKPPKRIKFPLSSQVEEGKANYDIVDGMWGFTVAKPEFSKKGNRMTVNVIDKEGEAFTENVGNGSVCTLKLFAYKNKDGQLVVTLDTMQVLEHVPYESKGNSDSVEDDVFGVTYKVKKVEAKPSQAVEEELEVEEKKPAKKVVKKVEADDDILDDIPF